MFVEIGDPDVGKIKVTNSHIKMSETKPGFRSPAPSLGQHNDEIYGGLLGYPAEKLAQMRADGII